MPTTIEGALIKLRHLATIIEIGPTSYDDDMVRTSIEGLERMAKAGVA